jgi:tRNA dimethylallyltransferase
VVTPSDRHLLHERIGRRWRQMLEQGLIDEVATLRRRPGLTLDHASMRCVGYRHIWMHLDGDFERGVMTDKALAATRQLAKRQLTALRQVAGSLWYDPDRSLTIRWIFRQVEEFSKRRGAQVQPPNGMIADRATPN